MEILGAGLLKLAVVDTTIFQLGAIKSFYNKKAQQDDFIRSKPVKPQTVKNYIKWQNMIEIMYTNQPQH